jgi:hypothetical protein
MISQINDNMIIPPSVLTMSPSSIVFLSVANDSAKFIIFYGLCGEIETRAWSLSVPFLLETVSVVVIYRNFNFRNKKIISKYINHPILYSSTFCIVDVLYFDVL